MMAVEFFSNTKTIPVANKVDIKVIGRTR